MADALEGRNQQRQDPAMMFKSEILFVDPSVSDIATILGGLRHEVEAIVLDSSRPAARQIAEALRGRRGLDAVHVIAHGGPGRVSFAAGNWSAETLKHAAEEFVAVGNALGNQGQFRLWSCNVGLGAEGAEFISGLTQATGVDVAAASGLVGAASKGGQWQLERRARPAMALPPLTDTGVASYSGVLGDYIRIDTNGARVTVDSGVYSIVAMVNGAKETLGQFPVIKGRVFNIYVSVRTFQRAYTIYSGHDDKLNNGQITIHDSSGTYNPRAAATLLGADGGIIAVHSMELPPSRQHSTLSARPPLSPAASRNRK